VRILFISDVYFPRVNGVSTSIQTFRRELAALGHETALVAPAYPARHADEPGTVRIPSRRVPLDPEDRAMRWLHLRQVHRRLAGERFDLVHIHTPFVAHYAGLSLARRWGVPAVATYHTLFEEYLFHYVKLAPRGAMRALARRFSRAQCNALDAVAVPSVAMRDTLARYGVAAPLAIVPTGIRLPEFAGGDGARFRARHGIDRGRPVALFVGRVAFEKNIDFLLRMLVRVRRDVPDVLLLVCGEGPAERPLARLAAALGLGDSVRFVGYLDRATELLDCYRAADVFVFASRTETQGLVLLEAMTLGVPVVAIAVMGTRDILAPGKGVLVPDDDERDFAAAVATVLRGANVRARLGEQAAEYAKTWTAPATARKLEAFYREVLERTSAVAASGAPLAGGVGPPLAR
jgi:glycosyltransferase involved in cell wall biosynthesis